MLDQIEKAALYIIGLHIVGFLISVAGLITSLFVETRTGQEQTED